MKLLDKILNAVIIQRYNEQRRLIDEHIRDEEKIGEWGNVAFWIKERRSLDNWRGGTISLALIGWVAIIVIVCN